MVKFEIAILGCSSYYLACPLSQTFLLFSSLSFPSDLLFGLPFSPRFSLLIMGSKWRVRSMANSKKSSQNRKRIARSLIRSINQRFWLIYPRTNPQRFTTLSHLWILFLPSCKTSKEKKYFQLTRFTPPYTFPTSSEPTISKLRDTSVEILSY